jgi:signal transduction histidine kinase
VAAGGFLFLLYLIYRFTSDNLTGAVSRLVRAARKISEGTLSDSITPHKNDELGYLAERMDEMRQTLIANRDAIADAHQQRLNSERLATIGQLAAGIIHDFKSPMTAIMMAVEGIQYNLGGEEKRDIYCLTVKSQVKRMVNMTQDLLDYAHGNKSLDFQEIDLSDFLKRIITEQKERFGKKGVELALSTPARILVVVDPDKFQRILDNLIGNAFEALAPGNRVEVKVRTAQDSLLIAVSDNGPGIPGDLIEDIFKPFVTKGKKSGTGLGLAISRKAVEDHGGTLTVESEEAAGAAFTIRLPRSLIKAEAEVTASLEKVR